MGEPRALSLRAPAKLNLYLDVLGRRDDGFHDLETLFVPLPWGDEIDVALTERGAGVTLEVKGSVAVEASEANLAWRAARAFVDTFAVAEGVVVRLHKQIPVGGGLGGGSSDAATVLRALHALTGLGDVEQLHAMGVALGADVPFFLQDEAATGAGRGDRLQPLGPTSLPTVVLIVPPFACSTATVFAGAHERGWPAPAQGLAEATAALRSGDPERLRATHYNALAYAALKAYPALRSFTLAVERRLGRPPALTGSGSTLFDVPDANELPAVLRVLQGLPGHRITVPAGEAGA